MRRLIPLSALVFLVVCSACQTGKIPCPKVKTAKLQRHYKPSSYVFSAKATPEPEPASSRELNSRPEDARYIQNVSMEEWDCPKPGAKRYMPKSVKDNIRRNWRKIESDARSHRADSVANR